MNSLLRGCRLADVVAQLPDVISTMKISSFHPAHAKRAPLPHSNANRLAILGLLSLTATLTGYAAPSYELESAGATGGGGVASGGVYRLVGTVVPAMTGEAAAGPYELVTISLVTDLGAGGEAAPVLKATLVAGGIVISWPVSGATFQLQETPALSPTSWKDNDVAPVVVNGENHVTLQPSPDARFFRLERR
jgi:hypothetical protein